RVPGPPELLPGKPDAVVDLQTEEGVALVGGQWRYSDCRVEEIDFVELGSPEDPLGPGTVPNRTYDVVRDGEPRDLAPADTMLRLAKGRVCFCWYELDVTIPERVGDLDPTGATVVFEVVIDDYAEVWVDGELPHALGDLGGHVAGGFNAPKPRAADRRRPSGAAVSDRGVRDQRPDLLVTAQLHLDANGDARLLCARASAGEDERRARGRAGRRQIRLDPRCGRRARAGGKRLRVHRGTCLEPGRCVPVQLAEHER